MTSGWTSPGPGRHGVVAGSATAEAVPETAADGDPDGDPGGVAEGGDAVPDGGRAAECVRQLHAASTAAAAPSSTVRRDTSPARPDRGGSGGDGAAMPPSLPRHRPRGRHATPRPPAGAAVREDAAGPAAALNSERFDHGLTLGATVARARPSRSVEALPDRAGGDPVTAAGPVLADSEDS
ncbi:hypothetical protein [Kitasatospora sp. NPDC059571]|uniref:hypothetical protein n=1 Tax=Kitasatospora sp. NPDC059571 TaxID=3346871 RepID=UPI0036900301